MNDLTNIELAKKHMQEFAAILRELTDSEVDVLFQDDLLGKFLKALLDPERRSEFPNIAEFLLSNKNRSAFIAALHHAIMINYSFKATNDQGVSGFASPSYAQWFDDGVMFLEGKKRFEGLLGLYRNGRLSYGVAARDVKGGDRLGPDELVFVDIEEVKEKLKTQVNLEELDDPLQELQALLSEQNNDESNYQELLTKYPWIFGAQYKSIQRHEKLDDNNIPDFTGVRVTDSHRDLFEIKPPFTPVIRQDGGFAQPFNDAWNQAERYLNFVRRNEDYLYKEKGLLFRNPRCYLIIGFKLSESAIKELRQKEELNRHITVYTYDDLLVFVKSTLDFIRRLIPSNTEN